MPTREPCLTCKKEKSGADRRFVCDCSRMFAPSRVWHSSHDLQEADPSKVFMCRASLVASINRYLDVGVNLKQSGQAITTPSRWTRPGIACAWMPANLSVSLEACRFRSLERSPDPF